MNLDDIFFNLDNISISKTPLGIGSYGITYLGQDKKTDQNLIIKLIKTPERFTGNDQMLFLRDVYSLKNLSHPGLVEFLGITFQSINDRSNFQPTIITEYISNGSLRDMLDKLKRKKKDLDPTQKYQLLLFLVDVMRYLHKNDIVHRNLKPTNILVDESSRPHLSDYGVSRCFAQAISDYVKETMAKREEIKDLVYMAPEMLNSSNKFDPTVDVYSFAMIAYEILTGKRPFEDYGETISPIALSLKIASGLRPDLEDDSINSKMRELLDKCWHRNVSDRPSFEEIFTFLTADLSCIDDVDEEELRSFVEVIINKPIFDNYRKTILNTSLEELHLLNQQLGEKIQKTKSECYDIIQTLHPTPDQISDTGIHQILFLFLIKILFFKHANQEMQDLLITSLLSIPQSII